MLLDNGLESNRINIRDVDQNIIIDKKIDLVISLKSMGYHYPFENYMQLFNISCNNETIESRVSKCKEEVEEMIKKFIN